ncbi:Hypothetical predicted protein [Octopus vulgaris]|uniref:Uncharacterized protein n=1 Tax=Octopus vulgaris TaxID=6645 RepID=A0AA36BID1_OCTVU|nr:Hypothetical predicted protein [Octopus vulgaris]
MESQIDLGFLYVSGIGHNHKISKGPHVGTAYSRSTNVARDKVYQGCREVVKNRKKSFQKLAQRWVDDLKRYG